MTKKINSLKVSSKQLYVAGLLMMAVLVMGAPSSAKADQLYRQLQTGMSGSDVSSLQGFLAQDATIYPQGLVTGYFGFLTKSAVSNFQSANGIPSVGRVGPVTMVAINAKMNGGMVGTDRISPSINPLNVNVTNGGAAINWNTDQDSAGIVYYGTSPLSLTEASANTPVFVSGSSVLANTDLRSSHAVNISGLQSNTTYYYVVYARDGSGNETISWPSTFHTNQ